MYPNRPHLVHEGVSDEYVEHLTERAEALAARSVHGPARPSVTTIDEAHVPFGGIGTSGDGGHDATDFSKTAASRADRSSTSPRAYPL